jgi:hypothetical protein
MTKKSNKKVQYQQVKARGDRNMGRKKHAVEGNKYKKSNTALEESKSKMLETDRGLHVK